MAERGSSNFNVAGNYRPLLKDLYDHVVNDVEGKWKELGVQLLRSDQENHLKIIAVNHPHDAVSCCKRVLEKWLDTTTDATWNQLITALRHPSVQLDYLANQFEQMLSIEFVGPTGERLTSIHHIEIQFVEMTSRIKQALINNNVDVVSLIEQLCAISAVKDRKVPLFDESVFEKIKSIDEFWRKLRIFWNFFDCKLLQCVVETSHCKKAQEIFEEFLLKIDPSTIMDVEDLEIYHIEEHEEGSLKPMLRITVKTEKCTLNLKKQVEEIVSKTYNLNRYALCFQDIKEGSCIELLYYISKPLKLYILQFKLSEDILAEFLAHKIVSLHVDEYELQIPSKTTNITMERLWYVHSQEDATLSGLTPKLRGVAMIIGNSYTRKDVIFSENQRELPPLPGSLIDVYKLRKVFEYLQFFTIVKSNVTLTELLDLLVSPLAYTSAPLSCHRFVFAFCGHGSDDFVYCEDEKHFKFSVIINMISNCDSLKDIPRLFFFDVSRNEGTVTDAEDNKWHSQISAVDDVLVAFSTSAGYETFEGDEGSAWLSILANKMITCAKDIHDVVMEANEELMSTVEFMGFPRLQQPELYDKLTTTVNLLNESGQLSKQSERKPNFGLWDLLEFPDSNVPLRSRKSSEIFKSPSVEQPSSERGKESHHHLGSGNGSKMSSDFHGTTAQKPLLKIGCYIFGSTVGHGTFGKVKLAKHEFTGHQVAVKIVNKQKIKDLHVAEKIQREVQIMKLLHHPHIIKLYEVIPTATDIFLILEYVSGGELFDYITQHGKSSEKEARFFFQQIISGVEYCHRHKVVHRDLKPENILLDSNNQVKIADFGLSNIIKDGELLKTSCGSLNYAAPEVLSGELYAGPEIDIWSCGIILFALLCGYLPFDDQSLTILFKKIRVGYFKIPVYLSQRTVDLLTSLLQVDPIKRITIHQIKDHDWFKQDLPEHLFPQHNQDSSSSTIDPAVINEVCQRLGVKMQDVVEAIQSGDPHNQLNVAYHLILDNKAMAHPEAASSIPTADQVSTMQSKEFTQMPASPKKPYKHPRPQWPPYTSYAAHTPRLYPGGFIKRSRWHLGIQSQSSPQDIMVGIFHKMRKLNYYWKVVGPYHVLVKYDLPNKNFSVKLDLQLYQIDKRNYLLDLRNIMPSVLGLDGTLVHSNENCDLEDKLRTMLSRRHYTMEFFEICSLLIQALIQ